MVGVESVVSGYCGGYVDHPSYSSICTGSTGHAEVVRVSFDANLISFEELLEIFFVIHDPTTPNRQGRDVGTQYRSVAFFHTEAQKDTLLSLIGRMEADKLWEAPIVTKIQPEAPFFAAEDEHQHYFSKHPDQAYCQIVVAPKVAKFRSKFKSRLRTN